MLRLGEAVVYKCKGIYEVEQIGTLNFSFVDRKKQYFTLRSLKNENDKAYVPVDDVSNIRKPMEKAQVFALIQKMDDIEVLRIRNEKFREQEYKECISGYSPEGWVRVLKTLHKRTVSRGSITSMDKRYKQLLEHALYSEIAYAMKIQENEVEQFIEDNAKK